MSTTPWVEYTPGEEFPGTIGRTLETSTPAWPAPLRAQAGSPNVMVVVWDDVGFGQFSAYGGLCETPTLDRLSQRGLRYSNFHTTALCTPTRGCLLTGRNHHSIGVSAMCVDGSRREQAFWVRWNSETEAFSVTGHGAGDEVDNDTGAAVSLPAKPADTHPEYTVASFHTHTPTFFRSVGRPTGPSGADYRVDKSDNVAGLVYDYSAKTSVAGNPKESPARLYQAGKRRPGKPN